MALTLKSSHVRHFHDPDRQIGQAVAQSLGVQGKVAWDIYLFYPKGIVWNDNLPPPTIWAHQLGVSDWADPKRYHKGEDLIEELYKAIDQLSGSSNMAA